MKLAVAYALGAAALAIGSAWLPTWATIGALALWSLLLVAAAKPYLRKRLAGLSVALLILAIVTAAPVAARYL